MTEQPSLGVIGNFRESLSHVNPSMRQQNIERFKRYWNLSDSDMEKTLNSEFKEDHIIEPKSLFKLEPLKTEEIVFKLSGKKPIDIRTFPTEIKELIENNQFEPKPSRHDDMKNIASEVLSNMGYRVQQEYCIERYRIDVIGVKDGQTILIEVGSCSETKLRDLRQHYKVIHIPYGQSIIETLEQNT